MPGHWNCCVATCQNNWRCQKIRDDLHYYRVPKGLEKEYRYVMSTTFLNFELTQLTRYGLIYGSQEYHTV